MTESALRIAIVGGGIGGLTLGLALRERGVAAEIFEAAPELTEIGAAVAQSANATRLFGRLGLMDELAAASTTPTELVYRHWRDGSRIVAHPIALQDAYLTRFRAPFFTIHRAELQRILSTAFGTRGLHLGCRLVNLVEETESARLEFANGYVAHADVVIGADGVRSAVRQLAFGDEDSMYSGTCGFRGLVPIDRLPSLHDPRAVQFWVGPGAHLLHFPIGHEADVINFLAVVDGPTEWASADRWLADVEENEHLAAFDGWHHSVTEMIDAVPHTVKWALFVVRPLLHWHRGRVVLLGDAAHAMLPHHGQGANATVEDAFTLAALLGDADRDQVGKVFAHYQHLRRARTRKIQRSSWMTSDLLHLPDGPAAAERDRKLARIPQDFAWIHDYDVEAALNGSASVAQATDPVR